jgi:uncharacterized membrane protein YgcG
MKRTRKLRFPAKFGTAIIGSSLLGSGLLGCAGHQPYVDPPPPLGSDIDPVFKLQEEDAEASKYVVYMHEFELNKSNPDGTNSGGWRLNGYGEDHLQQIAVNIKAGHGYPIVVERSQTSSIEGTEYGYPVHFNDELDATRREVVVASLEALGVSDADSLVIVAPAFAEGYSGGEAARAYTRGLSGRGGGGGGFGGGFGGGGGGFGGGGVF